MVTFTNFAENLDEKTLSQMKACADKPFCVKAALMPDAHVGYVAPIGAVLITKEYVVPSWVGFDIGCGMTAVQITNPNALELIETYKDKIFTSVSNYVPMGMGKLRQTQDVSEETKTELQKIITNFKQKPHQKQTLNFVQSASLNHVGTLGDGNHFIELCICEDDKSIWIVVHSGSRGIGYKLAQKYMKIAAQEVKEFEQTFPLHIKSQEGLEYLNVLEFGLAFALLNRMEMIRQTILAIESVTHTKLSWEVWTNKNHNHAIIEDEFIIHRKGATPAKLGERGVIPGSMKDGSFLIEGLGNAEYLESSSHGAGRIMGRVQAKKELSLADFTDDMKGIIATVSKDTLDESPKSYKDIYSVMKLQEKSVTIIKHLKPIINWKGTKNHG